STMVSHSVAFCMLGVVLHRGASASPTCSTPNNPITPTMSTALGMTRSTMSIQGSPTLRIKVICISLYGPNSMDGCAAWTNSVATQHMPSQMPYTTGLASTTKNATVRSSPVTRNVTPARTAAHANNAISIEARSTIG